MPDHKVPTELKYAKTDEWLRISGEIGEVGITDYAQDQLSDIVFVELPDVGRTLSAGETFGVVESVKAAADLVMPVGGEIIEVNSDLENAPEKLNSDPYASWIVRIRIVDMSNIQALLDAEGYAAYCAERE